ncbi:hypothetical protein BDV18DRAFT_158598 [Aspergillus unguis]
MDTRDVPDEDVYLQVLQNQTQILQKAQSQKGKRLNTTKSREEIIMAFIIKHLTAEFSPQPPFTTRISYLPPAYPPSVRAFGGLKKVMIQDLTLETHHRGSYAVLRAVTQAKTASGIMAIVEDEARNVVLLMLYNQEEALTKHGRLAEGTVLIVKEPYVKVTADGEYGIRVGHLSDVWFLSEHDVLVPVAWRPRVADIDIAANDWKLIGNKHFNEGAYNLAIDFYSKALESSPTADEALVIRLNRALAYLWSHQFDAALGDCNIVLADHKASEKALFRKSQALYHLQRFQESCDVHRVLANEYPDNEAAKAEFKRAQARLAEQQTGNYQFKRMQLEAKKLPTPSLDHATYIGPVAVRCTESRGRGLFTTAPVKAGDLLLCEKAFAYAFRSQSSKEFPVLVHTESNSMTQGTQVDLLRVIAQKLYKNPSLASVFNDLYRGSYEPSNVSNVDGKPVVDTYLIEHIMSLNCFGCPVSCRQHYIKYLTGNENPEVDKVFESTGIWAFASHANHSCHANAFRSCVGDMMIIRAAQDMPAGTEITFWYHYPTNDNFQKMREGINEQWGFKCSCILCQDFLGTPHSELYKRKMLEGNIRAAFQDTRTPSVSKIESLIAELEETYHQPAFAVPRLAVWNWYISLSALHATNSSPQATIETALKALESLSYVIQGGLPASPPFAPLTVEKWGLMNNDSISCWMFLAKAYRAVGRGAILGHLADAAEAYAKLTYRICLGEDETFDDTYGQSSGRIDGFIETAK